MEAFINEEALRGTQATDADAEMIADANEIIAAIQALT